MPITSQQLSQEPIISVTVTEPVNPLQDMAPALRDFAVLIATIDGPVYRIVDISRWNLQFSDLVSVLDIDQRRGSEVDPRVHTVIVSSSAIAAMGAKATAQAQYTGKETPMFTSLDEALAFVRAQLGQKK